MVTTDNSEPTAQDIVQQMEAVWSEYAKLPKSGDYFFVSTSPEFEAEMRKFWAGDSK